NHGVRRPCLNLILPATASRAAGLSLRRCNARAPPCCDLLKPFPIIPDHVIVVDEEPACAQCHQGYCGDIVENAGVSVATKCNPSFGRQESRVPIVAVAS